MRLRPRLLAGLWAAMVALLLSALPESGRSQEEPVPPLIWSIAPFYQWIAEIPVQAAEVNVFLNGQPAVPEEYLINRYQDSLHLRIRLRHHHNEIVVRTAEQELHRISIFHAPTFETLVVPEEAEISLFHTTEAEEPCARCHRMVPEPGDERPASPQRSLCFSCHGRDFEHFAYQHKETAGWSCLKCHPADPAETGLLPGVRVRYQALQGFTAAPLCYGCHQRAQALHASGRRLHGPVGMGACGLCHNPHGAQNFHFLRYAPTDLCLACHDLQEDLQQPTVHVIKEKGCLICHLPHSSKQHFLLKEPVKVLCISCHRPLLQRQGNHPVMGHPTEGPRDPQRPDREFNCVSCHQPHAASNRLLLKAPEPMLLCIRCHQTR